MSRLSIFGCSVLVLAIASSVSARSKLSPIDLCLDSISDKNEVKISSSILDSDRDYRSYESVKYGIEGGERSFVQLDEFVVGVDEINFLDRNQRRIQINSNSIAIERSDLYVRHHPSGTIYCLVSPFSGLGSSGRYQRYAALIAIQRSSGSRPVFVGYIYKR